jgi:formylglycine-generating enzyme required for sulfatase activity
MRCNLSRRIASVAALALGACSDGAAPWPQIVVFVDTDARLVGELATRQDVSQDAAMDVLRVDVINVAGRASREVRTFLVSDASSWPLSFGIAASAAGGDATVRIRLFRALFASPGNVSGVATLDPVREVTIDRLLTLAFPASGIQRVEVVLREDCIGTPSTFAAPLTTCIDGAHPGGSPREGVLELSGAPPPSLAGTWASGRDAPCTVAPTADSVCIPGGFAILGDLDLVGADVALTLSAAYEPVPLRPTILAPFLLDKYEMTVGRLRSLFSQGRLAQPPPLQYVAGDSRAEDCTWLGPDDGSNDRMPVNCIDYAAAREVCRALGADLPTEAQWEFAARGRGQRRLYPWGNAPPQCCSLSAGRAGPLYPDQCHLGGGLEAVASHPILASCGGTGDESRDGVFDLAGSVQEALLDTLQSYAGPCWGAGALLRDPVCDMRGSGPPSSRGSFWNAPFGSAPLPLRGSLLGISMGSSFFGFRCAYRG